MSEADELRLLRDAIKSFPEALAVRNAEGQMIACSDRYARLAPAGDSVRRTLRRLEGGGSLELLCELTDAYHDALTGLPNRRLLDDRLRQAIRLAQRRDCAVATLLLHFDNVRPLDDALLRELAARLSACVRKADTLARSGADEFALVVCDVKDEADCRAVAEKLLAALAPQFGVSIGVSLFPADAADGEALLRNAAAALYRAKQGGRNQVRFFGR